MNCFEELIQELGKSMNLILHAEQGALCKIHLGKGLRVQLEYIETKNQIVIGSFFPPAPPGLFCENLYLEALKENALEDTIGTFAYSEVAQALFLQLILPANTSIDKVLSLFNAFQEKAFLWKDAIEQNSLSSIQKLVVQNAPSPFTFMH